MPFAASVKPPEGEKVRRGKRGSYIVLSGGEGCGKTSVAARLQQSFPDALFVREPGHTRLAERVRAILLDPTMTNMTPEVEVQLFTAVRVSLVQEVVRPALRRGAHVVSDRGWPETFAYQWWAGMGRRDLYRYLAWLEELGIPFPSLWVYFDLRPEIGLARRANHGDPDRIDAQNLKFHRRVRAGFQYIFQRAPFPRVMIDAGRALDEVYAAVSCAVTPYLGGGRGKTCR